MNINGTSKNQYQNKMLIDTLIEQISALQTDVGNLQIADDNLSQALSTKVDSTSISEGVSTSVINAQTGNIKNLNVQGTGSSATIENATIGTVAINNEAVNQSTITNLEVMDVDAGTVRTGTAIIENDATISGNLSVQDIDAKDITSKSVNTLNTVTAEATINKLESNNAEIKGKLEVNDLEVSGSFTGVSHIQSEQVETESITADSADIDLVNTKDIRNWVSQVMNQAEALVPTPALSNIDRYTIELPSFNGIYLLSWEDSNVLWSATVIGNGKTYGISWGSITGENYVTDLFQFNGKAYIRINCNGRLKFAYSATKELPQPTIYYNMGGWSHEESLEELCTDDTHIINVYPSGLVWFGNVTIPSIGSEGGGQGINFKGSCIFNNLPSLSEVSIGDVWNITDTAVTNQNFVEGPGTIINPGDDVVAVKVDSGFNVENLGENDGYNYPYFAGAHWSFVSEGAPNNFVKKTYLDGTEEVITIEDTDYVEYTRYYKFIKGNNCLFCAASDGPHFVIIKTTDGENWTNIYSVGNFVGILPAFLDFFRRANGDLLFLYNRGDRTIKLDVSTNNGQTWSNVPGQWGIQYPSYLIENNSGILYACADNNFIYQISNDYSDVSSLEQPINLPSYYIGYRDTIIGIDQQIGYIVVYSEEMANMPDEIISPGGSHDKPITIDIPAWVTLYFDSNIQIIGVININGIGILGLENNVLKIWYINTNSGLEPQSDWMTLGEVPPNITISGIENNLIVDNNGYIITYFNETRLLWDKFSAGVNYENFRAKNITAETLLKSEGNLEVDGEAEFNGTLEVTGAATFSSTTEFNDDVTSNADITVNGVVDAEDLQGKTLKIFDPNGGTGSPYLEVNKDSNHGVNTNMNIVHNANYNGTGNQTITGNLNRTGNETISGVVIIGELN